MEQRAMISVSTYLLEQALHFPKGHKIISVTTVPRFSLISEVTFLIEGPTLPEVNPGEKYQEVQGEYSVEIKEPRPYRDVSLKFKKEAANEKGKKQ